MNRESMDDMWKDNMKVLRKDKPIAFAWWWLFGGTITHKVAGEWWHQGMIIKTLDILLYRIKRKALLGWCSFRLMWIRLLIKLIEKP